MKSFEDERILIKLKEYLLYEDENLYRIKGTDIYMILNDEWFFTKLLLPEKTKIKRLHFDGESLDLYYPKSIEPFDVLQEVVKVFS